MKGRLGWQRALGLGVAALAAALAVGAGTASAAEFSVVPVRLELGVAARSGALTVRNDGREKTGFQVEAMEWTQDAHGADRYTPTADLVFFPKILSVEPGQEAIIRVGARRPLVAVEKTYRVFIQEMPNPSRPPDTAPGAQVSVLLRFGAPVFLVPQQPADDARLDVLSFDKGVLTLSATNTGNRHQMIQGIDLKGLAADGQTLYTLTLADRYLLAGATKQFSATIDPATCRRLAKLELALKTDRLSRVHTVDVRRADCP